MKNLWEFDKFWVIWCSCIDKPRTLKEIQKLWEYEGNSLYQKGISQAIWKEMIDEGFLEDRGPVKQRGVYGRLLYAEIHWIKDFLDNFFKELKFRKKNELGFKVWNAVSDKKMFAHFLDDNRNVFYFIERILLLFGGKETLRDYKEHVILVPLTITFDLYILKHFSNILKYEDMKYMLSKSFVFSPLYRLNIIEYAKIIYQELRPENIPERMFNRQKVFGVWKEYTDYLFG